MQREQRLINVPHRAPAWLWMLVLLSLAVNALPAEALPNAYVAVQQPGSNSVSVIDTASNAVVATIPLDSLPNYVGIAPDGSRAYVASGSNNIFVIDTATNTQVAIVPVGMSSRGITSTPDGTRAYVTGVQPANTVLVIDTDPLSPTFNSVVGTVTMPNDSSGASPAFTPDGTRAYVTSQINNSVSVIDTDPSSPALNCVAGPTIPVGTFPFGIATTPDGTRAYVANVTSASVSVIDTANHTTASNTVVATVPMDCPFPYVVAITPDGTRAYVAHNPLDPPSLPFAAGPTATCPDGYSWVSVIDTDPSSPTFNSLVATIAINVPSGRLEGIDITPDGTGVYVTNVNVSGAPGAVHAIDTASNTVVATTSVNGATPVGLEIACFGDPARLAKEYLDITVKDRTRDFARFVPDCGNFTNTAHSVYFDFNELNKNNVYGWALIKKPLVVPASSGYGLDKWREDYGASRIVNSAYRNPARNASLKSQGAATDSRHMFGDAVDLRNQSCTPGPCLDSEWTRMEATALSAGADWTEPRTGPCMLKCLHADWRDHNYSDYAH